MIRVSQNRILLDPADGKRLGLVFDHIAGVAPLGGMYLDLRGRDGQPARRAKLLISCGPVRVERRSARAKRPARASRSTAGSSGSGRRIRLKASSRWNGCCTRTGRPRASAMRWWP